MKIMLKTETMQEKTADKKPWVSPEICDQQIKNITQAGKAQDPGEPSPFNGPAS